MSELVPADLRVLRQIVELLPDGMTLDQAVGLANLDVPRLDDPAKQAFVNHFLSLPKADLLELIAAWEALPAPAESDDA